MTAYQLFPVFNSRQAVGRVKPFYFIDVPGKKGQDFIQPGIYKDGGIPLLRQAAESFFQTKAHRSIVGAFPAKRKSAARPKSEVQ
jgi:hypothetical protein